MVLPNIPQAVKDQQLQIACMNGETNKVRNLIIEGSNANAVYPDKTTPLHIAVNRGDPLLIGVLLEYSATVDALDGGGESTLHKAINQGNMLLVQLLAPYSKDINKKCGINSPLQLAFQNPNQALALALADILLQHNAAVDESNLGETILHTAINRGDIPAVQLLARYSKDINKKCGVYTSLHLAVNNANPDLALALVNILLQNNTDINALDRQQETILHLAVRKMHIPLVKILLENGAEINSSTGAQNTPLHLALFTRNLELIQTLLDRGADVDMYNKNGSTALYQSVVTEEIAILHRLIKYSKDVNKICMGNNTALHRAVLDNNSVVVNILLQHGANINALNSLHKTSLQLAIENSLPIAIQLIEAYKAQSPFTLRDSLDIKHADGKTYLSMACAKNTQDVIEKLVEYGCNLMAQGPDGKIPFREICDKNSTSPFVIKMLKAVCGIQTTHPLSKDSEAYIMTLAKKVIYNSKTYASNNDFNYVMKDVMTQLVQFDEPTPRKLVNTGSFNHTTRDSDEDDDTVDALGARVSSVGVTGEVSDDDWESHDIGPW